MFRQISVFALALCCVLGSTAFAAPKAKDLPGAKDHPMVSRFNGSILHRIAEEGFASLRIPAGPGRIDSDTLQFEKSFNAEGKLNAYFYGMPADRTALEVFRSYEAALKESGFNILYSCEMRECQRTGISTRYHNEALAPRAWIPKRASTPAVHFDHDIRFLTAKATRNGGELYAVLFVSEPTTVQREPVAALVIIEPKPMDTGNVVANTDSLYKHLAEDGRIAIYGIYFDTGKAELKPESKPQLEEMAKLMNEHKTLKAFIVGHTDNQGTLDINLPLSQNRAAAVVNALVKDYKVDASRLNARGVANFAPVTSNASEAGRAKNRRVEMVQQ